MVEQSETYQWEITLADDSVKKEADEDNFSLSWETGGAVKELKMKQVGGEKYYSVNLESGEFDLNGDTDTPSGFGGGSLGDYAMRFFKRNRVRVDETGPLNNCVSYFIGYVKGGQEKLLKIAPAIGMVEESIGYAER